MSYHSMLKTRRTLGNALPLGAPPGAALVIGLGVFAILFAASSAVHSYLIVEYADADAVAMNVGFYYSANAVGRLVGTVLSGVVFEAFGVGASGLTACLLVAAGFVLTSALACGQLSQVERRLAVAAR